MKRGLGCSFALIGTITVVVLLIAVLLAGALSVLGFMKVIGPGTHVAIQYPNDGSEVPTSFHLVAGTAYWVLGYVDYSGGIAWGGPVRKLKTFGLKASVKIDGKEFSHSKRPGKTHLFKIQVPEGEHEITLNTWLGSRTIHVTAVGHPYPRLREVPFPTVLDWYGSPEDECQGAARPILIVDKTHLHLSHFGREADFELSRLPLIRSRYERLKFPLSQISFPRVISYQIGFIRCTGDYALASMELKLEELKVSKYTKIPALSHLLLILFNKTGVQFIGPPDSYFQKKELEYDFFFSADGKIVWVERAWNKDISYGEVFYVWDANSQSPHWGRGYGRHILRRSSQGEHPAGAIEVDAHTTEKGSFLIKEGPNQIHYKDREGQRSKKLYVPLVPAVKLNRVYSSNDPATSTPEVDIIDFGGQTYLKSESMGSLTKVRLYGLIETQD